DRRDQLGEPRAVRARDDREFGNGDVEFLAAAPRDVDVDVGWRLRSHRRGRRPEADDRPDREPGEQNGDGNTSHGLSPCRIEDELQPDPKHGFLELLGEGWKRTGVVDRTESDLIEVRVARAPVV